MAPILASGCVFAGTRWYYSGDVAGIALPLAFLGFSGTTGFPGHFPTAGQLAPKQDHLASCSISELTDAVRGGSGGTEERGWDWLWRMI